MTNSQLRVDNRGTFVSLEGLHGVGKTTVSQLLADELGVGRIGTIPPEFNDLRRILDHSPNTNIDTRFLFYLSAVISCEGIIVEQLNSGRYVVVESYTARTVAFHRGMGSGTKVELCSTVLQPDVIYHLMCDEEERQARILERGEPLTRWVLLAEENSTRILEEYERFGMVSIETTDVGPDVVVKSIITDLRSRGLSI